MTSASAASSAASGVVASMTAIDQVGPLREQLVELDLLLAPRERTRQELAAVGVDGDVARDVAAGENRRDEKGGNDDPRMTGRQAHDPRDRGDEWGASFLTIETGVEGMVRDGCQSGGRGRASLGPGHPRDLAQKQQSVISNCGSGRILTFPLCGYIHGIPARIRAPKRLLKPTQEK